MRYTLSEIWIYPVKSLGGIRVEQGTVLRKGLRYDRRWMLIDGDGVAMTQRVYAKMALFRASIEKDLIRVTHVRSGSGVTFPAAQAVPGNPITAQVWDDSVDVIEVDSQISKWFSHHLGVAARLVTFPERHQRPVNPKYARGEDQVSLADAFPFMIIGQGSLDDLNQRLPEPVPMNRFRPNLVFTGGAPFVEDDWSDVRIGNISFSVVKKCDRCVLTTVDQETGIKGTEPLRTLSGYRKVENKVYFGQNMIAQQEGTLWVGDAVVPFDRTVNPIVS